LVTDGIEGVYLTTHNWGKAATFFRSLGYELEFDTGHSSGLLRSRRGPTVFVAEVPEDQATAMQLVLAVPDEAAGADLPAAVEVVEEWAQTHHGTREMTVRDPDGRSWTLQATDTAATEDPDQR
jgi:hypothetical protein